MRTPSSRIVASLLFGAIVAAGCEPSTPELFEPEPGVTMSEFDPLAVKPACPGHPSCKDGDGGDSDDPSSAGSTLTAGGAGNALTTQGAQAAERKENKRTLEYGIPGGTDPFAVWITFSDATIDGVCATSGDFAGAGVTEADLKAILQQDLTADPTPVGDGRVVAYKRTSGPSDLNRIDLVWDPDPSVAGDYVARTPTEAQLLSGVQPPSATIADNADGSRTIELTGGVVRLTNRGAAQDWPTIECVNQDVITILASDGP